MDPTKMISEQMWQQLLDSIIGVRHGDLYQREAAYWRARAEKAEAALRSIESDARDGQFGHGEPAEPPPGTEFFDGDHRVWVRGDLGWYCAKENCENCPTQWVEVVDRLNATATRRLPS